MSTSRPILGGPSTAHRTLPHFFPRRRLSQYVAAFKADPLSLCNTNLMRDECEWAANGTGYTLVHKRRNPMDGVRPVELRLIGEVSKESFWLYPCGGWSGAFEESLDKAKASGRISMGRLPEVASLWPLILETLDDITFSRGVPTIGRQYPLVERGNVKIRHKIFEVSNANYRMGYSLTHILNASRRYRHLLVRCRLLDVVFCLETSDLRI